MRTMASATISREDVRFTDYNGFAYVCIKRQLWCNIAAKPDVVFLSVNISAVRIYPVCRNDNNFATVTIAVIGQHVIAVNDCLLVIYLTVSVWATVSASVTRWTRDFASLNHDLTLYGSA